MTDRKNMFDGAKVKAMIADMGLTSIEIAQKAGLSRVQMSGYIHGRRNPKRITVQRIADALHVKISEISKYEEEIEVPAVSQNTESTGVSDALTSSVLQFIFSEIVRGVATTSQLEVAKKTGLSHAQINRIVSGKADLSNFPVGAFLRLCPQLINRNALTSSVQEENVAAWLFRAIGGMNDSEKLMLKNVIETTMPRFACHGDSKNEKPELCASECMGNSDSNGEGR